MTGMEVGYSVALVIGIAVVAWLANKVVSLAERISKIEGSKDNKM